MSMTPDHLAETGDMPEGVRVPCDIEMLLEIKRILKQAYTTTGYLHNQRIKAAVINDINTAILDVSSWANALQGVER
jgi:hypothetical protein